MILGGNGSHFDRRMVKTNSLSTNLTKWSNTQTICRIVNERQRIV